MKETIKVIHNEEVISLFKRLNIFNDLIEGKLKCNICDVIITENNFRSITKIDINYFFCCSKEICYLQFLELTSKGEK